MKYYIEVSGKGSESFIFRLTEDQEEQLFDADVESGQLDTDYISDILNVDFITDTDEIVTGVYYDEDSLFIKVKDESGKIVWTSGYDFKFSNIEKEYLYDDTSYLLIEDYQKGIFFNYELETDKEFDPSLLTAIIYNLLDNASELIVDIKYDEQELDKELGDTISKGFNYKMNYYYY